MMEQFFQNLNLAISSIAGLRVAASPTLEPIAEPTNAARTPAISDSVSESVTEDPAVAPI